MYGIAFSNGIWSKFRNGAEFWKIMTMSTIFLQRNVPLLEAECVQTLFRCSAHECSSALCSWIMYFLLQGSLSPLKIGQKLQTLELCCRLLGSGKWKLCVNEVPMDALHRCTPGLCTFDGNSAQKEIKKMCRWNLVSTQFLNIYIWIFSSAVYGTTFWSQRFSAWL